MAMTLPDFASRNVGNLVTGVLIFIALWFDPRIGYIQRDIATNTAYALAMDNSGTRKDQQDIGKLQDEQAQFERRLSAEEQKNKRIEDTLTAILNKLSK